MKTTAAKILLLSAGLFLILQACTKEDQPDTTENNDNERNLAAVKASSDVYFEDISQEVLQVNTEKGLTARREAALQQTCATVTVNPLGATFPKTVTIDFGTTGCDGPNGFTRKGKVIYTISNKLIIPNAQIAITFDNFTINGHKLEGTYTIRNNGSLTGLNITTTLENGKITYPDGKWYTKTSNVTWVQAAGAGSPLDFNDDVFNLSGEGTVTSSDDNTLTAASQDFIVRKYTCYNAVSGKLDLTYNAVSGVLDYGNGDCDKKAVLTIGNKNYDITLP